MKVWEKGRVREAKTDPEAQGKGLAEATSSVYGEIIGIRQLSPFRFTKACKHLLNSAT